MAEDNIGSSQQSNTTESRWIDVSIPYRTAMVHWPEEPPPQLERIQDVARGDSVTLTGITMNSHTGTHIDAPLHFIQGGKPIDEMPIDAAIGRARVIEIKDNELIRVEELAPYKIQRGERILFKTRNSSRCYQTDEFVEDYVALTAEAARFLVDKGVGVIGIDYLSVGNTNPESGVFETHRILLSSGIWIIESLNLWGVKAGMCEFICLPLRLERGDAGPARAILKPL